MRYVYIILVLLWGIATNVSAQRIRLGERIPEINVQSEYGSKLEYAEQDLMCMVFFHSKCTPCVEAIQKLNTALYEVMDIALVTAESPELHDTIISRIGTRDFAIAYDIDGKTHKSFGINYVPFAVIYSTHRKRVEWFGPIEQLGGGTYCE